MSVPPLLDFETLLQPITGDNPCGVKLPHEIKSKLEEARREDNPDDYEEDDARRPATLRQADWPGIIRLGCETITDKSKDLLVAARITEALVKQHRFAGLRDGLRLLRELVETHWDHLYPAVEDGDLEPRLAPLYWLDQPVLGARFPSVIRLAPLVAEAGATFSWYDWRPPLDALKGEVSREEVEKAIRAAPLDKCEETLTLLGESIEEMDRLTGTLDQRVGREAPGLIALRQAVSDCQMLMTQIVAQKRPADGVKSDRSEDGKNGAGSSDAASRTVTTRAEAYRQLRRAADVLQQLEPHSPIPYLVKRAVELGELPFPQLIRRLVRDANVLAELDRELGLQDSAGREQPPAEASS